MVDTCSTCYFCRPAPADTPLPAGNLTCRAPRAGFNAVDGGWLWPIVKPDYWCGWYSASAPVVYPTPSPIIVTAPQFTISQAAPSGGNPNDLWWKTPDALPPAGETPPATPQGSTLYQNIGGVWTAMIAFPATGSW
jgi:hypothetical protein